MITRRRRGSESTVVTDDGVVRDYGGIMVSFSPDEFHRLGVVKTKNRIRSTLLLHGDCPVCGDDLNVMRRPAESLQDESVYGFTCSCGWGMRLGER